MVLLLCLKLGEMGVDNYYKRHMNNLDNYI